MTRSALKILLSCLGLGILTCQSAWPQVSVWTHRYDNARTGANLAETQLNTSNVNSNQFGKLFSYGVDADIYAQPLVIANVNIVGKGNHDVVYVATNNNSVYAFDADNNQGANDQPLWQVSFNGPGVTPIPASDIYSYDNIRTPGPIGIMGTPVIDQMTGTMYLVARTKETSGSTVSYVQRLHALDITSGAEKFGGPVVIQAVVSGTGYDNVGGSVTFNPLTENQRAGLALANGNVYIAWASYGDSDPYHGWVMAYSASTLQQVGVLCITPNGTRGGIWQSGQPLSVDASGDLYVATGNGDFDGVKNFGETVLKLSPTLAILDWFAPGNWAALNGGDLDLSSAGVLLVPNSTDVIGAGKEGVMYVLNQTGLGHTQPGDGQIVQTLTPGASEIHGSPTYWSGPTGPWAYVWGAEDYLKAYAFTGSTLDPTPVTESTYKAPAGLPGGFLTISANASLAGSGILWASMPYADDAEAEIVSGVLHAFDATDLTHELWSTRMVPARDDLGNFAKFVPPTVANGRVYLASFSNRLLVYGLLGSLPPVTGGSIFGSGSLSTATVNLTATGTADWAQWPGYNDKSIGYEQISDLSSLGQRDANTYANDPRTLAWNDGTVTACGSSTAGASISGTSNGFLITVPADTTSRTLNLYVGGSNSRGMLTAQLSDGSATDFVDTGLSSTGQYDGVYTLTYYAASAGQQLTVMWTLYSGSGNVTLQGAALIGATDPQPPSDCVWVDDAVPLGATLGSDGGDNWYWVSNNPTPYSGRLAHQSGLASGEHQHSFSNATTTLSVAAGDTLFSYVFLDPANPPSEVMLQWYSGNWEHRAYWGADLINWGTDGTVSRVYMGPLPATGQWVRLAVPAAQVGLAGITLSGMAYTLYGGRATWDYAGKSSSELPPTTTTLVSSANPSTVGASVTFTATVAGSNPTGSVNFTDGGSSIAGCAAVALSSGKATCTTSSLAAATHSIVANYGGDANNAASVSTTLAQVVNKAASTTTLASSVNPSAAGASVTFTATVAGSSPTGSVNFTDGGSSIAGCAAVALSSSKATCTTSSLATATHSIVGNYGGDANNAASASTALAQVVNKAASVTTLTSSVNPSAVGASVTFTATVAGSSPTGSVNFTDGGSSIAGCGAVTLSSGTATCTTSSLAAATHSIVANYGGDANNAASASTTLSQVVNKAASATTLASSANPSIAGASVTFTATVAGSNPTGSVNFTDGGSSIAGCGAVTLSSGKATCTTSGLTVATHSIVANYGGDANNAASASTALAQVVNASGGGGSSIDVALAANGGTASASSTYVYPGYSFSASAVVNGDRSGLNWGQGGGWNDATANVWPDWVQINFNGQKTINQVIVYTLQDNFTNPVDPPANMTFTLYGVTAFQVQGWNGTAWVNLGAAVSGNNLVKRPVSFPALTTNSIRVNITAALDSYSRIVEIEAWTVAGGATATTTTLTSSVNPSTVGASVTFTATVAGSNPTGSVNFTDGGSSIGGCATVALSGGKATCTTSSLAAATHSIVANYGGDANNAASASTTLAQVVNKAASTTTLASSVNPSAAGASVTFTATVAGSSPTGSVNFTDGGSSIAGCAAVALSSGKATCTTSSLAAATHSIVAHYGGDANNQASASAALSQVVNGVAPIDVALAANGGTASASSTYVYPGYSFSASAVINGDRTGLNWGQGGGWDDATANVWPDWVQINFNGQKTIDQVIVYTLQDNFTNPVDPPANLTFTLYGVTAFQVQGWNGTAWVNLGAAVSGNNLVKRPVSFAAFTTNSIRVNITAALDSYSRIVEIEAWGN